MRLAIDHLTRYHFDGPVTHGLQRLRLTPPSAHGQQVIEWALTLDGGRVEAEHRDQHGNHVTLVSLDPGTDTLAIRSAGRVEVEDRHGIIGRHAAPLPLWYYLDPTPATRPGPKIRALAGARGGGDDGPLVRLHALSDAIRDAVAYRLGTTAADTSGEEAATAAEGVCQDHAHIFIAAARLLGFPARYVSGYLLIDGRTHQDAGHGWAEAHVEALGWVGFDISNGVSPDDRYVRLATGRDYAEAAPVKGLTFGARDQLLHVTLAVEQQLVEQ